MKGNTRGTVMSRACEQLPCKSDWGSATLGRPRGRGFVKNLDDGGLDDSDVVCNGSGQVVAALVEDARMLGRINLGRRVRGPGERGGEVMRGSSPPLVKPLRLVAVKDDDGRIRMKPEGSLDDSSKESGMEIRVNASKIESTKNGSGDHVLAKKNESQGCNTARDATAMRGITMKDGGRVRGLGQNGTRDADLNISKGAKLNIPKKGALSEMMSTQAGYTIKRNSLRLDEEEKLETCFLCGKPSVDQVTHR